MKYGLIGGKLGHSFSKEIHEYFGNPNYEMKELAPEDADSFFEDADFEGINVTIPYKLTAYEKCVCDEYAGEIGSVNTVVKKDNVLYGYNTDAIGFFYMVSKAGISFKDRRIAVLGKGGVSKTVIYMAQKMGAKSVDIIMRGELPNEDTQVIVNATPVGMFPDNNSCLVDITQYKQLESVVDLVANPIRTKLVCEANERGLKATGGLVMLVAQAYFAEKIFNGENVGTDLISKEDGEQIDRVYNLMVRQTGNIVFVGMPGAGKSTIGKCVADKLGKEFFDSDVCFEQATGIHAGEYIKQFGENEFRDKESEVIKELSSKSGIVISTGGGSLLRKENVLSLKQNGTIVFLQRDLDELSTYKRPLSANPERKKALYYKRLPIFYRESDVCAEVLKNSTQTAESVLSLLENYFEGKKASMKIAVINGSNINMLGIREPEIYGRDTYEDILNLCEKHCREIDVEVTFYQSNHEGELVDIIQRCYGKIDGIVINPGAYTHTSVAILDALKAVNIPTVEIHITDPDSREDFRHVSYVSKFAFARVTGEGIKGYVTAIDKLIDEYNK